MKTNSPTKQLWDDSSCTVSEEYSESPLKNNIYHWKGNANVLGNVTGKSKSSSVISKRPILTENSCFQESKGEIVRRSVELSKPIFIRPQDSKACGPCYKVMKRLRKSSSSDVLHFPRNFEEMKSLNWKEKCEESQMIASSRILLLLHKKS
ncbi:unnamed protein product [Moneuplotes crassus]|uniref:Uncharacterized protein n=1 Tax=Euplotes crassus TaxID=5936 RepID=A0AAD1X6G7_EUPCR|nr:unnamed protein product [Moneuplotes crassus]